MAGPGGGRSFPLSVVIEAVDKVTAPLRKVGQAIDNVGGKFGNIGRNLGGLVDRSGLPVLGAAFANAGGAARGFGSALLGIGQYVVGFAAGLGLSVVGVREWAQAFADATGAIGDAAERTGASRQRIQELGYAAQLTGSSAEVMNNALKKMTLTVGQASAGSKELKEMFSGLGINIRNSNGSLKSTDQLFDLLVNRISRIKNPALQAQAATKIFGEQAAELLPLLRSGNKGVAELAAEARRLGVVLSTDALAAGEEMGDVLDKLNFAVKGAANAIMGALAPQLNTLGTMLTETIVKYRPQIEAFGVEFAQNLPRYIDITVEAFQSLYRTFQPVGQAIGWLIDTFGAGPVVLGTLGTAITAVVLPPLITLTSALYGVGAALLATPIGWFVGAAAAIGTVALVIYKNWDKVTGAIQEKITAVRAAFDRGIVKGIWTAWKEFNPVTLIMESWNGLIKFITGFDVGAAIGRQLSKVRQYLPNWAGGTPTPTGNPDAQVLPQGVPMAPGTNQAKITLDFRNMPKGTDVQTSNTQGVGMRLNQGYSMVPQ